MVSLIPIETIAVDLGKPTEFTPPSIRDFAQTIVDEANAAEEHSDALYKLEQDRWRQSLSPSEKAAYELLEAAEREAEKNYNARRDGMKSEPAQAYFKASDAKDRFYESHGKHICFRCSYYTKSRDDKKHTADCFKLKKAVRPMCDSCQNFTIDYTPEDREIDENERIYLASHPQEAEKLRRKSQRERAKNIAAQFGTDVEPCAFISYWDDIQGNTSTVKATYQHNPDIFENTKYPTFEEFKAAATAWMEAHSDLKEELEGYRNE